MVVVGMSVIGVAILYATFYVWLGVDSPGSMKIVDCKLLPLMHFPRSINKTRLVSCFGLQKKPLLVYASYVFNFYYFEDLSGHAFKSEY